MGLGEAKNDKRERNQALTPHTSDLKYKFQLTCVPNVLKKVEDLEIKEMSIEEKYDKLYDQYVMTDVIAQAFIKEMGLTEKYIFSLKKSSGFLQVISVSESLILELLGSG